MSIKIKLVSLFVIISLLGIGCSIFMLRTIALNSSNQSIHDIEESRLVSLRDIKKGQIEKYFENISHLLASTASNLTSINAANQFIVGFHQFYNESKLTNGFQSDVVKYYQNEFADEYQVLNAGNTPDIEAMHSTLSNNAKAMQFAYIMNNPNPLGEKDKLFSAKGPATYNKIHEKYHPTFRSLLTEFGFYDIFIADVKTGNIVYSVYKELDFATSLKSGPYASTGIARAFTKALEKKRGETVLVDFADYLPSYDGKASFMAAPIFEGNTMVAVLIAQMPIDKINEIMTYNEEWQKAGLGESGETYLVGQDLTMRSISRFLIEDKSGYLNLMKQVGTDNQILKLMDAKSTSIGLQTVNTIGVNNALSGREGFMIFPDYRGVEVLSAYTKVNLGDFSWALMSEIDKSEAFLPATNLLNKINTYSFFILIIISIITAAMGYIIVRLFSARIVGLKVVAESIASGNLNNYIVSDSNDEIGDVQKALAVMQKEIQTSIEEQKTAQENEQARIREEHKRQQQEKMHKEREELRRREEEKEITDRELMRSQENKKLLQEVIAVLKSLASGHLDTKVYGSPDSEFIEVKDYLNETIDKLSTIITSLMDDSHNIAVSANEVANGNNDLNARTQSQSASLEEISASITTMAQSIQDNTKQAELTVKIAADSETSAKKGSEVANNAVDAMRDIEQSSRKIQNIISVIDEIAFQTNLLALNAAVEAARAGDTGRGFAVVASEVRNLAQRSASSAKEIEGLIKESTQYVEQGRGHVLSTKASLDELVDVSNQLSDSIKSVSHNSSEQSQTINEINSAIGGLDSITQQNAALVEQVSAAGESMSKLARQMQENISYFRIDEMRLKGYK